MKKKTEQQISFVESTGRLQICFMRSQGSFQQVALVPAFGMSWNVMECRSGSCTGLYMYQMISDVSCLGFLWITAGLEAYS